MIRPSPRWRDRPHKASVALSLLACLLLGLLLLLIGSSKEIGQFGYWDLFLGLVHDMGLALCISFVVAVLFEIYRSLQHEIDSMNRVIDVIMGDRITPAVWMEVSDLIKDKTVIRHEAYIRLEFRPEFSLAPHEAALSVENSYKLLPLCVERTDVRIQHELDYQFNNEIEKLPRWCKVVVEPPEAKVGERGIDLDHPAIDIEVKLPPRDSGESVFVQTSRIEMVHLPGSYNFYFPEFTKGFKLNVVNYPNDFEVQVLVRPRGGGRVVPGHDDIWIYEKLLFPGQGIEIKFVRRPKNIISSPDQTPVGMQA